jgi:hypothetical protein
MNLIETLEYFLTETAADMEGLSWELREETNYEDNNTEYLAEVYDFNKALYDNLQQIKSELARLQRYDEEISSVMPKDYKDWWQNSKEEWPIVAKSSIESLREREELAWEHLERATMNGPTGLIGDPQ